MKKHGLTQQQFVTLKEIQEKGPVTQKDVCSDLLLEKSNVSKIVSKLVSANLVRMKRSLKDGRATLLVTTQKGEGVVNSGMEEFEAWNRRWLESLSSRDLKNAAHALEKLAAIKEPPGE